MPSAESQVKSFLAKYDPAVAKVGKAVLAKLRTLVPGAIELVYDNYNALAIGFSPTERASDVVVSIALYPRWVSLFFLQNGPALPDPTKILRGSGSRVRHVVLEHGALTLDAPEVRALIDAALRTAKVPIDPKGMRRVVVKSIATKQRPRTTKASATKAGKAARKTGTTAKAGKATPSPTSRRTRRSRAPSRSGRGTSPRSSTR